MYGTQPIPPSERTNLSFGCRCSAPEKSRSTVDHIELVAKTAIAVANGAFGSGLFLSRKENPGTKLPEPKCWKDLIRPDLKGEVQVADPNSSGTSYTMLATMVQLLGEAEAFEYLKKLHRNVNQYTKSGSSPIKAAAQGETTVGIVFMHDAVTMAVRGAPIKVVAPCEGTGYEVGSMSIIKGARNLESAKRFYDWALTAAAQSLGAKAEAYQVPSNKGAATPSQAPKLGEIKLIDYDFAKYGTSAERKRLLEKWGKEVKSLPQ